MFFFSSALLWIFVALSVDDMCFILPPLSRLLHRCSNANIRSISNRYCSRLNVKRIYVYEYFIQKRFPWKLKEKKNRIVLSQFRSHDKIPKVKQWITAVKRSAYFYWNCNKPQYIICSTAKKNDDVEIFNGSTFYFHIRILYCMVVYLYSVHNINNKKFEWKKNSLHSFNKGENGYGIISMPSENKSRMKKKNPNKQISWTEVFF